MQTDEKIPLGQMTVLAFMAHPDDAEISCGGTLLRLAEAGCEIHIATAAAGNWGTTSETCWAIAHRRMLEAGNAAATIGGKYHCIDECDGLIVYDKPSIRKTIDLFRQVAPSLVFLPAPRDYMVDHEMASLLGRAASFVYGVPNASGFPLLPKSRVPYLYYCDPMEGIDPLGHPITPTTYIDISAQLDRKAEALACHVSQREWLRAYHGMDEYIDSMKRHAAMRGQQAGVAAAEAFVQHRGHAYPKDDILAEHFGIGVKR
jgi:LmbE family N-acetylglucosaminyl deacetylase